MNNNLAMGRSIGESKPGNWFWAGRIPSPGISVFCGPPMEGRRLAGYDIAARATTGEPWPDRPGEYREPVSVILSGDHFGPRTRIWVAEPGADLDRVYIHDQKFRMSTLAEWTKYVRKGAAVVFADLWCLREVELFSVTAGRRLGGQPRDAICRKRVERLDSWSRDFGIPVILDIPFMSCREDVAGILDSIFAIIPERILASIHIFTSNNKRRGRIMHTVALRGGVAPDLGFQNWGATGNSLEWHDPATHENIADCPSYNRASRPA